MTHGAAVRPYTTCKRASWRYSGQLDHTRGVHMRVVAFICCVLASGAHAQAVYRCGSTYSETPCAPGAAEIPIQKGTPAVPGVDTEHLQRLRENMQRARAAEDAAIKAHCSGRALPDAPHIGMDLADLLCLAPYRRPDKVNTTHTDGATVEQRVYRRRTGATYVYVTDGKISAIQESR